MSVRRPRGAAAYAVADLTESVSTKWRGYLDRIDPLEGIHGWALIADAPLDRLTLELVIGDTTFARVHTGLARSDIDSLLGVRVTPGFFFPRSVFSRMAHLNARRRELPVRVRFADTNTFLLGRDRDPTVGELVDAWCRQILDSFVEPRVDLSDGQRLLSRLTALRTEAAGYLDLPLHPTSDLDAGQIDTFHMGSNGQLWFTGWMVRDADTEFLAVLIDRQKFPAAGAVLHYERQDLASRYVGVVGVLDTGWSPAAIVKEFFLYVGAKAALQVRVGTRTQIIGSEAFLRIYREAQASVVAGNAEALASLLTSGNSWMPGNAPATGMAAEASVDRLWMIPGFGCLVEGWAVSPIHHVQSVQLKLGATVLEADAASLYFRPRPDVAGIFAGSESVVARGGFVAVLRGDAPRSVIRAPLLRILYTDGTFSTHGLEAKSLHRLDYVADSAEVLRLFPSLRHEAFYPALLDAVRRQLGETGRDVLALSVTGAQRVIIVRLPVGASNQRLCFDLAARWAASTDEAIGCCFIADQSETLTQAKLLFGELSAATAVPMSLFCLQGEVQGFAGLPVVLAHVLADRFVYVDAGALLTPTGWSTAAESLTRTGHSINYFEFIDDTGSPDRINGAVSAACFGWTTAAFYSWLPGSTPFLRGVCADNGLPEPASGRHVFPGAAMRVERAPASRLADLIDADLLASCQAAVT